MKEISQEFKSLLGQQINKTLTVKAIQPVSTLGKGVLELGILPNGVITINYRNSKGAWQYSFVNYKTLKKGSKNIDFLEEFVLSVLQACDFVESNLANKKGISVPSYYDIQFKVLTGNRVKWNIS
jgi:hypothetical protein